MPSDLEFPMPFGGICRVANFATREEFRAALTRLTQCHGHNIAVEGGAWGGVPRIWGSEMAMECMVEDQRLRAERSNPYDEVESLLYGLLKDWFTEHTATRRRDMPSNIAVNLRRDLQRMGITLCRAEAPVADQ